MCITWPNICFTIHLLWCISYTIIGTIQVIIGVFFFALLPMLKLGSNIWVGVWNIIFGIGGAVFAMIGKWTLSKQRTFLYVAVSVLIANVINLVLLEIGEWHILLPENVKKSIEQGNVKMLVLYARTITTLSTIVAAVISFLDSQITFCSMQYHERFYHKKLKEKEDILSDTEYVLPRVKSDSDENENASYFSKPYPQSWVFETQTAETSTINSVPNRYSGTGSENIIDSKQTSSEAEFKDISTQNLNIEQPIVVVENTSDYTDRQLHYMASFSRTPSPVPGSESSSEHSCSIHGEPECLEKLTEPAVYRSRLNSAKSTSAVIKDRPSSNISPRPPSISDMDQLQHDSLMVELQETTSNKSFKISADQIFIPLKDETVIRIKDEIFIKPAPKISPQESNPVISPTTKTETKKEIISSKIKTERSVPPEVVQVIPKEKACAEPSFGDGQKKDISPKERPYSFLSSVEQVVKLTSSKERPNSFPLPATQDVQDLSPRENPYLFSSCEEQKITLREKTPLAKETLELPLKEESNTISGLESEEGLKEAIQQYLRSSPVQELPPVPTKTLISPKEEQTALTPPLERQMQIEREDTAGHENESYMLSSPQFDRQNTVISQKVPTPVLERQAPIERQDAIISPKEDQSFITSLHDESIMYPSPLETNAGTTPETDEEFRISDDVESNNSNNASTDRETIVDLKGSDDEIEMPIPNPSLEDSECGGMCDALDLIEGTPRSEIESSMISESLGNEIDNIFKIAEDPVRLEDHDREDADLFNLNAELEIDNLPPPEVDQSFANIPPPAEIEEMNGVDPDEWEESDDDDSIDSSCMRRVPPPSTPND